MNSSMDCIVCQSLEMDYVIASRASVSLDCKFTTYFASLPLIVMMFLCRLIKHPAKLPLLLLLFADTCVCVFFAFCFRYVSITCVQDGFDIDRAKTMCGSLPFPENNAIDLMLESCTASDKIAHWSSGSLECE